MPMRRRPDRLAGVTGDRSQTWRDDVSAQQCISAVAEASDFEMIRGTREVLALVSGKWSVEVLYLLASGTRRYSEMLYEVGEVSKKSLTHILRSLEAGGLIARRAFAEVPPRVEYSLTPLGWSLTGPLMVLYEWAAENLEPTGPASRPRLAVVPDEPVPTVGPTPARPRTR
jgi:DNA-binding HxlR family transcriptional regulator